MSQSGRNSDVQKKSKKPPSRVRWIVLVFIATMIISACFTLLSSSILDGSGTVAALVILLLIILIGIAFDVVGVAVTAAEERPLHSMAAKKVPGAKEAIGLIKNADRVASICNDVVGDICGVVSGSASAVIAVRLLENFTPTWSSILKVAMSALVAGLTVGGKAIGKGLAMRYSVKIVHFAGRLKYIVSRPFSRKNHHKRSSLR